MRKDMSKVIVERPRLGRAAAGLRPGRTRAVTDDDGEPLRTSKGPAREPRGRARKTKLLNETLNPLKRYLASNVERPWNKVYSEISANLKATSTVQQHVRDHLEDFVAVKTRMKAGVVMVSGRFGGESPLTDAHHRFYVHPRTGILRANPNYRRWNARYRAARAAAEKARAERMRIVDAKTQLHRLKDDVWWEVKLGKIGDGREPDVVFSAGLSPLTPVELYGRENTRAVAKRQLNKAEKKKLGLS